MKSKFFYGTFCCMFAMQVTNALHEYKGRLPSDDGGFNCFMLSLIFLLVAAMYGRDLTDRRKD